MRTSLVILAIALSLIATDVHAKNQPGARAGGMTVDCDRGRSLNQALARGGPTLHVRFRGTCSEDVVVRRGNVILEGEDGATIQGSLSFDPNDPAAGGPQGPVRVTDVSVIGATDVGVGVLAGARVTAERVRVSGSGAAGFFVNEGGHLVCIDCESFGNGGNGMSALANATVRLAGNGVFSDNSVSGISVGSSAEVTLANATVGDLTPVIVTANGNVDNGIVVFGGGSILVDEGATVEAHGNGSGPGVGSFGAGFLVGTGSAGFMSGTVNASGNDAGIFVIAGSLLMFGDTNVSGNLIGMFTSNDGVLRPTGTNTLTDNTFGVLMQSGVLQLGQTTFSGSVVVDLNLAFGAKVRSAPLPGATVFCDGTVLTLDGFVCP